MVASGFWKHFHTGASDFPHLFKHQQASGNWPYNYEVKNFYKPLAIPHENTDLI
jgi:hypothetical protein